MNSLKNIAVLYAHTQIAALPFAGEFAAQTAKIHGIGNHYFKNKERLIGAVFAQYGLEAFNRHLWRHARHK